MTLSDNQIKEFQDIYEKEHGEKLSWENAADAARRLSGLAELAFESFVTDKKRTEKLKEYPKGFHIEGQGYSCFICGDTISDKETWYDKYGIKCLLCQKAINKKIIPGSMAKNKESWYSLYDLKDRFNIDRHAMKRFIKEDILKPRIVPNSAGSPHVYLFLIKDNKETLPPKNLTESRLVKEMRDGQEWVHSEQWYKFADPQETLKDYKIINYLQVVIDQEDKI